MSRDHWGRWWRTPSFNFSQQIPTWYTCIWLSVVSPVYSKISRFNQFPPYFADAPFLSPTMDSIPFWIQPRPRVIHVKLVHIYIYILTIPCFSHTKHYSISKVCIHKLMHSENIVGKIWAYIIHNKPKCFKSLFKFGRVGLELDLSFLLNIK